MDEEDIASTTGPAELSRHDQMMQYAQLGGYFVAIYIACYLICRLLPWHKLGGLAALVQGLVLIAVSVSLYYGWGLRFCRIEEGYDLVKAFGIGFITLIVGIGGSFHGEYGRVKSLRRNGGGTDASDEDLAEENVSAPEI